MRWRPETRAKWGAKFLDRVRPGWWRKVKVTKLDQRYGNLTPDGCGCVLAQLEGDYLDAIDNLGLDYTQECRYGLVSADKFDRWTPLTEAWRNEVRARRKAART